MSEGSWLVAFDTPERELVIVDTQSGQAVLHDLSTGFEIGPLTDGSAGPARAQPVYAADGSSVWLATGDSWREYPLDPNWWQHQACDLAGRELSDTEWDEFVSDDVSRVDICG